MCWIWLWVVFISISCFSFTHVWFFSSFLAVAVVVQFRLHFKFCHNSALKCCVFHSVCFVCVAVDIVHFYIANKKYGSLFSTYIRTHDQKSSNRAVADIQAAHCFIQKIVKFLIQTQSHCRLRPPACHHRVKLNKNQLKSVLRQFSTQFSHLRNALFLSLSRSIEHFSESILWIVLPSPSSACAPYEPYLLQSSFHSHNACTKYFHFSFSIVAVVVVCHCRLVCALCFTFFTPQYSYYTGQQLEKSKRKPRRAKRNHTTATSGIEEKESERIEREKINNNVRTHILILARGGI